MGRRQRFGHGRAGHSGACRGGRTVGVIPKMLVHREVADTDADELIVTDTMRERKQVMEDRADAFIALPGGIGTLEELFEAWTGGYLGVHDKPVVMLDPDGHYDGLRAWLYGLIDSGYVSQMALDRLVVVDDVDAALAACAPVGLGWPPTAVQQRGDTVSDHDSGTRTSVGLADVAARVPAVLADVPVLARGR
ncbi:hypothetical protein I553_9470 [Mycobacterium xenopi 4042]|uniref:Cytokinin riboside 5'-monophosphate phosphoribohydrolase n=1 Tax=Mycobacterium xenopi 4042 TaxID=1299334 RepID=X8DY84_MYCXE|nr:hypothetical protein I553_9470 [Mycobacterium xenopi 4042]